MRLGYKRIQLFQGTSPQYSQRKKPCTSPTNMSNIHQLVSEKGKPMIFHEGFLYTLARTSEEKLIFRCKNRSCKGKLKLLEGRLIKMIFSLKGRSLVSFLIIPGETLKGSARILIQQDPRRIRSRSCSKSL